MRRYKATLTVANELLKAPLLPHYGHRLVKDTKVRASTLYGILQRFRDAGWLADRADQALPHDLPNERGWRPARHYYVLTAEGRRALAELVAERGPRRGA